MNACIVVNPTAGRGRAARLLPEVRQAFDRIGVSTLFETKSSGDEERVTLAALANGFATIVVVGGDGTCSRVAGTLLAQKKRASLALVPVGTGNDFAKTLGVNGCRATHVANLVATGKPVTIDVGIADGQYFLNSCGFGFDAAVLQATQSVRFLKGDTVYIWSALKQLFTYRGQTVSVKSGSRTTSHKLLMLTVSNGQHLGGAFRIAPGALATDGLLDVGLFSDASVVERIRIFAGAFRGTHQRLRAVESRRVSAVELKFHDPPMMEIDGELQLARSTAVSIECAPRVLSVIAAPGAHLSV